MGKIMDFYELDAICELAHHHKLTKKYYYIKSNSRIILVHFFFYFSLLIMFSVMLRYHPLLFSFHELLNSSLTTFDAKLNSKILQLRERERMGGSGVPR